MNIVANSKTGASGGTTGCGVKNPLEVILGDLDVGELVVVIRVQVEVADDVSQVLQYSLAGGVARRVRRTHVCRVLSDNVADGHLVLDHLVVALRISDDAEILVGPCVGCDLVALGNHALDHVGPLRCAVNGALAKVDTSHEESSLKASSSELVEDAVGVNVWTVVVGDGDCSSLLAGIDTATSVCDIALLRTRVVACASSTRSFVGIASWAEVNQAVGSLAVIFRSSAVSGTRAAVPCSTLGIAKARSTTSVLTTLAGFQQATPGRSRVSKRTGSNGSLEVIEQVSG